MTVNPFWFGVLVTLTIEMAILIVVAAISYSRMGGDDDEDHKKHP